MKPPRRHRQPHRRSDPPSKLSLKEIIGLNVKNANGLASDASSAKCVYVAGCVAVVYDADLGAQSHLMASHRAPRPLTCVAVSRDGRYVAAGESGNQPSVLVWDSVNLTLVSELKDHLYGVACIAFSPDGKHLVSVGGYIYLWDWQDGQLVTKLKASSSCSSIISVTFSVDAKHIVTAGSKHLKLWSLGFSPRTRFKREADTVVIQGKPINLGPEKGSSFVSVASPFLIDSQPSHAYALTEAGTLCVVQSCSIVKTVDLKVEKGFALSVSRGLVACACSNGLVQLVSVGELRCAGVLSYAMSEVDSCVQSDEKDFRHMPSIPDAVACQFLTFEKIAVVYGDHSLCIWDICDVNKATRCCMLVSHSNSIWDIKNLCCENLHNHAVACTARGCSGGISFATCSADGTIRLWVFLSHPELSVDAAHCQSVDLEPVITSNLVSAGIFERDMIELGTVSGFRSLAASSDGEYLAAGDSNGNLHIYNLQSFDYMCLEGAHDAEILSLCFNIFKTNDTVSAEKDINYLLTSGGRDRIIHVYDVKRNFDNVQSIVDHSAAVTSVKLTPDGHKLVSCSADRSLVIRDVFVTEGSYYTSRCHHQMASSGTVYDMVIDPSMDVAVTVGQDKKINVFDIASGQLLRSFKPNGDYGDPIKVIMDPSCCYLVCSYSNKSICMYDFVSGEMVAQAMGHSEVVTGVIFLPDFSHIVSVGGDSCIFVWKIPNQLSSRMLQTVTEISGPLAPGSLAKPKSLSQIVGEAHANQARRTLCIEEGCERNSNFKFRMSLLPKWAQTKVAVTQSSEVVLAQDIQTPDRPDPGQSDFSRITGESGNPGPGSYETPSSTGSNNSASVAVADNHWLTVYTVFTDLQNSPSAWVPSDNKNQVSSQCAISRGMQKTIRYPQDLSSTPGECSLVYDYELHQRSKCETWENGFSSHDEWKDDGIVGPSLPRHASEQSHADWMENKVQETIDVHVTSTKLEETDLFKEHFGSLSAAQKVLKRESSARKRFSSRFVVRRNYIGDWNKVTGSPGQKSENKSLYCHEELANLLGNPIMEDSAIKPMEDTTGNLKAISFRNDEVGEKIIRCKEALLGLESAAETTSRLFSELLALASEEELSTQLLNNVADCLPSIAETVHKVMTLVQDSRDKSSSKPPDLVSEP